MCQENPSRSILPKSFSFIKICLFSRSFIQNSCAVILVLLVSQNWLFYFIYEMRYFVGELKVKNFAKWKIILISY